MNSVLRVLVRRGAPVLTVLWYAAWSSGCVLAAHDALAERSPAKAPVAASEAGCGHGDCCCAHDGSAPMSCCGEQAPFVRLPGVIYWTEDGCGDPQQDSSTPEVSRISPHLASAPAACAPADLPHPATAILAVPAESPAPELDKVPLTA